MRSRIETAGLCPLFAVLLAAVLVGTPGRAGAQQPCADLTSKFDSTVSARNLDDAIGIASAIQANPGCSPEVQRQVGRRTALLHLAVANQNLRNGQDLSAQEPLVRAGLKFGDSWQALALMGDIKNAAREYPAATEFYQRALNDMNDTTSGAADPPPKAIERIVKLAAQTRMLAPDSTPPKTRTGEPGGLGLIRVRNIEISRVPQPIQFVVGQAVMTESGRKQAQILFEVLSQQGQKDIRLVGHTDPTGPAALNLILSKDRAEAVKRFLLDLGYRGRIDIDGKGPNEPLEIEDAASYTEEQRYQILRRVELVRLS